MGRAELRRDPYLLLLQLVYGPALAYGILTKNTNFDPYLMKSLPKTRNCLNLLLCSWWIG